MKPTTRAWLEPATTISVEMKNRFEVQLLNAEAIERLAGQLQRIDIRRPIVEAIEQRPKDSVVLKELQTIERSFLRLSEFACSNRRSTSFARNKLGNRYLMDELGDPISVDNWLSLAPEILSELQGLISEIQQGPDWHEWRSDYMASQGSRFRTRLIGEHLPKLFRSLYPGLSFGGRVDRGELDGAGFVFIHYATIALDQEPPSFEAIHKAMQRVAT